MKLKESVQIGNLNLRNRIVMPPMATGKAKDGKPGDDLVEYYRARAKGTALIIVEHEYILPQGMAHKGQLSMADDSVIPAFKVLTDAAHGYLLNQFYSPLMNKREDEYSTKTMENRTRLHKEVVQAVRTAVGDDFTVAIRFGACDFLVGGSEIRDIPEAIKHLEQTGVDLIDVTAGMMGFMRPGHTEPGYLKDLGLAAKSVANLPIILTGGVQTAQDAEKLLTEEACDLIGVGRAILKDAEWAVKALEA